MVEPLTAKDLRKTCDDETFGCITTAEVQSLEAIIGQERALSALKFGLGIKSKGFNIFVAGRPGTGRTTAVRKFLEEEAKSRPVPWDWVYVNNFKDTFYPKALSLPPGRAKVFQENLKKLIDVVVQEIRNAFESDDYAENRKKTLIIFQHQKEALLKKVNEKAYAQGFAIQSSPMGVLTIPLLDGKPISDEDFMALDPQKKEEIKEKQKQLQNELESTFRLSRDLDKKASEALQKLDKEVALFAIKHLIDDIKEKFADLEDVMAYLDSVQEDILENQASIRQKPEDQQAQNMMQRGMSKAFSVDRYEVNVLVDHSGQKGAPVVAELNPNYKNLIGQIEYEAQFGALVTNFSLVRSGALLQANGGYLVLPVEELLRSPYAWEALKRALANEEVVIESAGEQYSPITTKGLRPAPIPLDVKVILIGQPQAFQLLQLHDENFHELFKVKADFDIVMDRNDNNIKDYVEFASGICKNENLKDLDRSALSKVVEHGSRLAGSQNKLSTHFGMLSDVIREANYYAVMDEEEFVSAKHIKKAIDERFYRANLIQERIREMIENGTIMIDVDGKKTGQVNGLSVLGYGDVSFGQPNRITASIGMGKEGLVNIEREADLSGPFHTKGVLILHGYLMEKYAHDKPLSLSARLVFEQSYSGVDGDSASSTELYALLSALSGVPIKQGIAVTGSVNQRGEVQAIGGVNEKIEGFFEVCKAKGLTGNQGVMIPYTNVQNLMLREEVVDAVKEGKFNIYPVKTIDEGIEVLTGVPAGESSADGAFAPDSIHDKVNKRLENLAEKLASFGKEDKS